ncbi:11392_t:CDS:1, partial [Gigaspora margarita]
VSWQYVKPLKSKGGNMWIPIVENKAKSLVKYLSKLSPLLGSLNDYS